MLPPIILPLAETNPVTYSPVGANTAMLPTPLTDIVTLAAAAEILTLLLPFITFETDVIMPVSSEPLPSIKLPVTFPVVLINPLDVKLVNVPTEVIFGCAFVVIVAAVPTALPADRA